MKFIEKYFHDLDQAWKPGPEGRVPLYVIGSAALFLQTNYERGTKDSDVLETAEISPEISKRLKSLAGKGTPFADDHRMYMDVVRMSIPFLPQKPVFHDVPALRELKNFSVKVLDVVDVVISKLKPYRNQDISDIRFLASENLLPHKKLLERFRLVMDYYSMDARAEELPKFVENLNEVERSMLFVPESKIELPDWIA